ncbi:1-deoxy-D-xylulose-5-phosphate reductoisomerase [Clostridium sp. DL1XJH146]
MRRICVVGATGSVGSQSIDVIRKEKNLQLKAFSANKSYDKIVSIIEEFKPEYVAISDLFTYKKVIEHCKLNNIKIEILLGLAGINEIVQLEDIDLVLTSIVGMIGLVPTIKAIEAGKDIALANKETLVTGGKLVMELAKKNNVKIIPVDSEHSAIYQCLQGNKNEEIDKIILTASGGPFRGLKKENLNNITPERAIKHPKWNMGPKISIDSSTLMNKGLEVIEAHWLFEVDYSNIEVLVHPQSMIHSMVQYVDGSVIAQISSADMQLPIQYAINYPHRKTGVIQKLDFTKIENLTFEKPDLDTFDCLKLAYEAGKRGGLMPTILNASNEVAVDLFLNNKINYLDIPEIIYKCLNKFDNNKDVSLEYILGYEKEVRSFIINNYL